MKKPLDDRVRLQHIFDAVLDIEKYMQGCAASDFFSNSMLHSACIRQLEIIGEAAGRVSEKTRAESADIPWKEVVGLRNFLIHEYFGVDLDVVLEIIETDMPKLKDAVRNLLAAMPE
jgi:uncharacterized protein with HEPN domain